MKRRRTSGSIGAFFVIASLCCGAAAAHGLGATTAEIVRVANPAIESAVPSNAPSEHADTVFVNASVYTVDTEQPWAEAIAIRDGRFVKVGDDVEVKGLVGPQTEVVDLGQRLV